MPKPSKPTNNHSRLDVCDGRLTVGHIEQVNSKWRAIAVDGTVVGEFHDMLTAPRSFPNADRLRR
jgi:hypothetical protein